MQSRVGSGADLHASGLGADDRLTERGVLCAGPVCALGKPGIHYLLFSGPVSFKTGWGEGLHVPVVGSPH